MREKDQKLAQKLRAMNVDGRSDRRSNWCLNFALYGHSIEAETQTEKQKEEKDRRRGF